MIQKLYFGVPNSIFGFVEYILNKLYSTSCDISKVEVVFSNYMVGIPGLGNDKISRFLDCEYCQAQVQVQVG